MLSHETLSERQTAMRRRNQSLVDAATDLVGSGLKEPPKRRGFYTPPELQTDFGFCADTIRKIFRGKPGVRELVQPGRRGKRRYRTMLIPYAVAAEQLAAMTNTQ
jgi:hypothetical protein